MVSGAKESKPGELTGVQRLGLPAQHRPPPPFFPSLTTWAEKHRVVGGWASPRSHCEEVGRRLRPSGLGSWMPQDLSPGKPGSTGNLQAGLGRPLLATGRAASRLLGTDLGVVTRAALEAGELPREAPWAGEGG